MADRIAGLIGPGLGLKLVTAGYKSLTARITNLTHGKVLIYLDDGAVLVVEESCEMSLPCSRRTQFEHEGESKNLICLIIGEKEAA